MSRRKTTSQSLIIAIVTHGAILLVLWVYLAVQSTPFEDFIDVVFLKVSNPPQRKVRHPTVKTVQ